MGIEETKSRFNSKEMKEFTKNHYKTHIKLLFIAIIFSIIGFIFSPANLIAFILYLSALVCITKNWKKIKREHKEIRNIMKKN